MSKDVVDYASGHTNTEKEIKTIDSNLYNDNNKKTIKMDKLDDSTKSLAMNKGALLKILNGLIESEHKKVKNL